METATLTPRAALAALAVVCSVCLCRAAVIPGSEHAVGAPEPAAAKTDLAVGDAPSPPPVALTAEAFRAPQPTSAGPGARPGAGAALGAVGPGARRVAAPGAESALDPDHALAHHAPLDSQPALDPAHALLRVAGAGQRPGLLQQLGVAPAARGAASDAKTGVETDVETDLDKGALLQAIVSALQGGTEPADAQQHIQQQTTTPSPQAGLEPPAPPSRPLGQVKPTKVPRFSDSFLPALVQVLNHVVDLVEEREQVVEVPATTTAAYVMETVQVPPAPIEVIVVSPNEPLKPDTANQVIISGPLAGIASLLTAVATSVMGTPGTASVSITDNHSAKDESVGPLAAEALTTEPAEAATQAETVTEDVTRIDIQDATEAAIDFVNKDLTEAATEFDAATEATTMVATEDTTPLITQANINNAVSEVVKGAVAAAVGEVVEDAVKEVLAGKDLGQDEPVVVELLDDEDMQEDMPVVQNDVPVVNEETVPMTMMMSMVMDDAGPLSFGMSSAEEDDDASTEGPGRSRRAADVFPDEFKTYVEMPTEDSTLEALVETTTMTPADDDVANEAEFADDSVFALPQYRGEAVAVGKKAASSSASDSLLALVKLRFALSAEARRQNFKNFQGYSDRVLAALTGTSSLTAREQLGALLAGVLDQKAIKSPKTTRRAVVVLSELEDATSELSRALEDLPALKYRA